MGDGCRLCFAALFQPGPAPYRPWWGHHSPTSAARGSLGRVMQAVRESGHSRGSSDRKGQELGGRLQAPPFLHRVTFWEEYQTQATPQGDVITVIHFSEPQFPQLHMGVSVGCWEDNERIPGWSGPHSPSMISSFTLWSSRTTSSRISCWAESQSEGTDAGSRGCRGLSLSQALGKPCSQHPSDHNRGIPGCPGTPFSSTGQLLAFVAVKQGTHWLEMVPACRLYSLSPVSSGPNLRHPGPHHLHSRQASPWKKNGRCGRWVPGSIGTHAGED